MIKTYELKRLFMNASNVFLELSTRSKIDDETRKRNREALEKIKAYADNLIKDLESEDGEKD